MEIRIEDASTGLKSGCPTAAMPYSVSVPKTLGMATGQPYRYCPAFTRST